MSKDVFDVYGSKSLHNQFKNDGQGFKDFSKTLPSKALVVMEATGYYHYRVAQFLYKNKHIFGSKPTICKTIYPDETSQSKNR